jgi:hypothetical protein
MAGVALQVIAAHADLVAHEEDQRFGIPHSGAAAPSRRDSEDQCQRGKQQHLPAVARDCAGRRFRIWRREFSARRS